METTKLCPEVVKVAIAVPLSRLFDYLPCGDILTFQPGARVLVPFGRGSRVGVVVGVGQSELPVEKLKPVRQLLDTTPVLSPDIVSLLEWSSSYYRCPVGEAFSAALPVALRKVGGVDPKPPVIYRITEAGLNTESEALKRAPVQNADCSMRAGRGR